MDLSIIIVNWNVRELLAQCLDSVFQQTTDLNFEVIVVDNASTDDSAAMVRERFPQVTLIANADNKGFASANNQGAAVATGDYLLFLNPDTQVAGNVLSRWVQWARVHQFGIAGCKIVNPNGSTQHSVRPLPTPAIAVAWLLKMDRLVQRWWQMRFDYGRTQVASQVMGAVFLMPRPVFDQLGGWDERFWLWFEEVDFCKRAHAAGLPVLYVAEFSIVHHGGESFGQVASVRKQRIFNASLLTYMRKHFGMTIFVLLHLLIPVSLAGAYVAQWQHHVKRP